MPINTVIFDLGGVLVDWNPRYVYKSIFATDSATEHFLSRICTNHWNELQDEGRSFAAATDLLIDEFPHYTSEIKAYYGRWEEMLKGQIDETVEILESLKTDGQFRLLALTNWSAESFPVALQKFEFLSWFDGILVSGNEKLKKPDPAIFRLLMDRYNLVPDESVFIDDNYNNIVAAKALGINTIHFIDSAQCRQDLMRVINWG